MRWRRGRWTTEIVVVLNQEVTDGTEQIAKSHGAKVIREPWKGMIGQKASVAAKATQEWILDLDADEVVSDSCGDEIQQALRPLGQRTSCGIQLPSPLLVLWKMDSPWRLVSGPSEPALAAWAGALGRSRSTRETDRRWRSEKVTRQPAALQQRFHQSANRENYSIQRRIYASVFGPQWSDSGTFDLAIRPVWRFLRAYFFAGGFLDGWPGYYIAWLNAFSTVTRYAKVRENIMNQNPVETEHSSRA